MASLLRRPRSNITSSQHIKSELQVSAYDRYASMLIALLIVVGFAVVILFLLWLTTRVYAKQELPKVLLDNFGDGAPLGNAEDLEPPGVEELPDVQEPQVADTLDAITELISSQARTYTTIRPDQQSGHGSGLGSKHGTGMDRGRRPPVRKINYSTKSLKSYATQLDYFKVELGVIQRGKLEIQYAFNLAQKEPDSRQGRSNNEKRPYFLWTGDEPMVELDKQLLRNTGIEPGNGIMLQFWPEPSWRQLLTAESLHAKANNRNLKSVRRTDFGVKPNRRGYEIVVLYQR